MESLRSVPCCGDATIFSLCTALRASVSTIELPFCPRNVSLNASSTPQLPTNSSRPQLPLEAAFGYWRKPRICAKPGNVVYLRNANGELDAEVPLSTSFHASSVPFLSRMRPRVAKTSVRSSVLLREISAYEEQSITSRLKARRAKASATRQKTRPTARTARLESDWTTRPSNCTTLCPGKLDESRNISSGAIS